MSPATAWRIMRKEIRMGPRSPLLLWAIVLPAAITLVVNGVFGSLFAPSPRLGIADEGDSAVTSGAMDLAGISVTLVSSAEELRRLVEGNDLDAGLVLPAGFDAALTAGEKPVLRFFVGGESLASNRIILAVSTLGLVREAAAQQPLVTVEVLSIGEEESLSVATRLIPAMVIMVVAISGGMVPAAALVDEKERRTLSALLVTPATAGDVLAAKAGVGVVLAMGTGVATLALNNAFGHNPLALLLVLAVAALMMVEFAALLGVWAKDTNTLFAAVKTAGILFFFPVILYLWPGLPGWIPRLGPTYYFLQPLFAIAAEGAGLGDVWPELAVAGGIILALLPAVGLAARRLAAQAAR
jgi:ABC-2 type transport system permease protein